MFSPKNVFWIPSSTVKNQAFIFSMKVKNRDIKYVLPQQQFTLVTQYILSSKNWEMISDSKFSE